MSDPLHSPTVTVYTLYLLYSCWKITCFLGKNKFSLRLLWWECENVIPLTFQSVVSLDQHPIREDCLLPPSDLIVSNSSVTSCWLLRLLKVLINAVRSRAHVLDVIILGLLLIINIISKDQTRSYGVLNTVEDIKHNIFRLWIEENFGERLKFKESGNQ